MSRFQSWRRPALWAFLLLMALLSLLTPMAVFTFPFLMLPALVLYMLVPPAAFAALYAVVLAVIAALLGKLALPLGAVGLFLIAPVALMAWAYRRKKSASGAVTAGVLAVLAQFVLAFAIAYAAGYHALDEMASYIKDSYAGLPSIIREDIPQSIIDQSIDLFTQTVPLYLVLVALMYVLVAHALGRKLLRVARIEVPGLAPLSTWMLPKSMVLYYVVVLALEMMVQPKSGSLLAMIVWNVQPLLMLAFSVQAIGFLLFVARAKNWNKALPIAGIVLFPFLPSILSLIGVFDVVFPIRQRLTKR